MTPLSTFIVITLGVLAIFDIIVGVSNDAVNFLNSAFGSKIAKRRTILIVAAIGILIGTLTSSGMMEVARSGVFHPGQFCFEEIMMLFLGMIIADILLLDIFNSLGLPTSTTVSMVFGLLGAAVGIALHRISSDPAYVISDMSQFINSGKAMVIISAILLSVVLSFAFGALFMYISRVIFSFRFNKMFNRFGPMWCGISFTGIIYFSIFKGLKSSGIIPDIVMEWIASNTFVALVVIWIGCSILLAIAKLLKVNILKATILTGTFSLALAFAGNDLVNFIGVPLAGYESYKLSMAAGGENIMMGGLAAPATANFGILSLAGLIMVITLFFSKKAMNVTKTELSLSDQNESDERFGSSFISRGLVRGAIIVNSWYEKSTPDRVQRFIESRFTQLPVEERTSASYDLIRATVNLTAASILISIATSFKLPLSTTYVVFMVAMGSSLADRAWGRESAVYRVTGVITVVSGWFLTAFAAFSLALTVASILIWGGGVATVVVVAICLFVIVKSNFIKKKKSGKDEEESSKKSIDELYDKSAEEILIIFTRDVCNVMSEVNRIYNRTMVAVAKENRKVLKSLVAESDKLADDARNRKYDLMSSLKVLQSSNIDTGHFYVQVVDYQAEVTKALIHITRPAFQHIDNNHEGLTMDQTRDLMHINDQVELIFKSINEMLNSRDFSSIDDIFEMRERLFEQIADAIKKQLRRIKDPEVNTPTRASMLYLTILSETKTMMLQSRNLLKSQKYFLQHMSGK